MLNKLLNSFKTKQPMRKVIKKPVGLSNSVDTTTYTQPLVSSKGGFRVSVEDEMNKVGVVWFTEDTTEVMFNKLNECGFSFTLSTHRAFQGKPKAVYYKSGERVQVKDWLEVELVDGVFYNVATR